MVPSVFILAFGAVHYTAEAPGHQNLQRKKKPAREGWPFLQRVVKAQ
jgi:hypothetical protein